MADNLDAPLSEGEALNVRQWVDAEIADYVHIHWYSFVGKTPEYVALMLRMDGYTSVKDSDVLKAAGRV